MDQLLHGTSALETKIRDLEHRWKDHLLKGDWAGLGSLQSPDFVLITHHGDIINSEDVAKALSQKKLVFHSIHIAGLEVRIYGSTAVVLGAWDMKMEFYGNFFEGKSIFSSIWIDIDRDPKCVCVHSTDARLAVPWKQFTAKRV